MSDAVATESERIWTRAAVLAAASRLSWPGGEPSGDFLANPDFRDDIAALAKRPAAVLIGLIDRPEGLSLLLTKRHDNLSSHSGQVAFPGGKIDPEDPSPEAAALREAREEVGLDPRYAEIIGRLPDYLTGSGYRIAPVVALISPQAEFRADPTEVDYVFEAPLDFVLDPANRTMGSRIWNGRRRYFYEIPYGRHYIWGVTAGMIVVLGQCLAK
jgi:8-oxo-dGTP pyrophosphatase MutT (NUDIX family)